MAGLLKKREERVTLKTKHLFHPLELAICGHSGSGKTTLISKLINRFSKKLSVGYIKHDAHHFEMDKEGKDTFIAKKAGAKRVGISSSTEKAFIISDCDDGFLIKQNFIDSDVVLIEGYKDSLTNKILVWSGSEEDKALLAKYLADPNLNLLAVVGKTESSPTDLVPYFHRDDIKSIFEFIDFFWKEQFVARPLYGLVLSGGKSKRMGRDKGSLNYHGKSQVAHLYGLLEGLTEKTFVSCRSDQASSDHIKEFPRIEDHYIGFGPTGGILSAFHLHPEAAWLVLACDMPFINEDTIRELLEKRNSYKMATCFYNGEKKWPEPLCAIYEPKAALKLGYYLANGKPCPRKVLMNSSVECLKPIEEAALKNANTPSDFEHFRLEAIGAKSEN